MAQTQQPAPFKGRILMLGCGSVGQCTLPLLRRHIDVDTRQITVVDFQDVRANIRESVEAGVRFEQARATPQNYRDLLARHVGPGDLIVDLSWNVETLEMLEWCGDHDVRFINTSVEEWDPYGDIESKSPYDRSLYSRQMRIRKLKAALGARKTTPATAIIDNGANPGLVSYFTKRALLEIAVEMIEKGIPAATGVDQAEFSRLVGDAERHLDGSFARLSQATGTKVVHISERDTQITNVPKQLDEFVNTWSIEGFFEEGTAPAELGWGTHERRLPPYAHTPIGGPGNQIFLAQPGIRTLVHSWLPAGGEIIGMVVRHAESFTISDFLTVWDDTVEGRRAVYRPTVHYAYMPCDNAILSLYELTMRNYRLQSKLRIMTDEITEGMDELGVLLLGHGLNGWWTGSQLDIHEARRLVAGQNATTLQVAAAVLAGVVWMIQNPCKGILVPDELPYRELLEVAGPYLGPCPSVQTDWTPLQSRSRLFAKWGRPAVSDGDVWQFEAFRVDS
ncbi:MAG: saccharopine dehydrogenase NADP-binding domain-containing protein [Acidobacteria bacterium]|nr:saccharopine dehydrogenase NADP-binding domain-containing protein [Acidobacteriota bacterium]MBI3264976.1 saccharopine dehydrogenase NADP-binding domain-containing protein [Acidobacteriota bacterium]